MRRITSALSSEQNGGGREEATNRYSNSPVQLTSFIGREQEVKSVSALLRRPSVHLLTITGPGGVGKTRLALQVASELLPEFTHGVCFVNVAPLNNAELVLPAIAQALGLGDTGDRPLFDFLQAYLQDKHLLLLLDNFEQVTAAAVQLSVLLALCSGLKALVTSQAVLHVPDEYEFSLSPLALPDLKHLADDAALVQYPAVALFLQRTQATKPDFQPTPANMRVIAEICTHLDGLPLAIELAAARIRLLPPTALQQRLTNRMQVLTSGPRDGSTRQQTLRNTLTWSYNLLNSEEQRLFRRLSVFIGQCPLEAVEAMYTLLGEDSARVLELMASLLDKSLLQRSEQDSREVRLSMLGTIREYGLESLLSSGEMAAVREAHASYYVRLAEEAELQSAGSQQRLYLERLDSEQENLRVGLTWFIEQHEMAQALRLSSALWWFWGVRGYLREGQQWLEQSLKNSEGVEVVLRAKGLNSAGMLAYYQNDFARATALFSESLQLYQQSFDRRGIAILLYRLGLVAWMEHDYSQVYSHAEEALASFRALGDQGGIADALLLLAHEVFYRGDYARVRVLVEESLALFKASGDTWGTILALLHLGRVVFAQRSPEQARTLLEESLALSREMGYKGGSASALALLGQLTLFQNDHLVARSYIEESLALGKELDDRWMIAHTLSLLVKVAVLQRDDTGVRANMEECLAVLKEVADQEFTALCLSGWAEVLAEHDQLIWAAHLWGAADTLLTAIHVPIPPIGEAYGGLLLLPVVYISYERTVTAARTQLGAELFAAEWVAGRQMTPEQALTTQAASATIRSPSPGPSPLTPTVHIAYPARLTVREVEVLRLLARGMTNAQIAQQLAISLPTVNAHLRSIYNKLDVTSRSAATRYAIEHKLMQT